MSVGKRDFTIRKGQDWSQQLQLTTNAQEIVSSTDASPIVVTIPEHGLSNGAAIYVSGHTSNKAANGNRTVANKTADTFELSGTSGSGVGRRDGYVSQIIDATGASIRCRFKKNAGSSTYTEPTVTWVDRTKCIFTLSLTGVQTAALVGPLQYDLWFVDSLGVDTPWMEGSVIVEDSIS